MPKDPSNPRPSKRLKRIHTTYPSLYTLLPTLSSLPLGISDPADTIVVRQLSTLLNQGVASTILEDVVYKDERDEGRKSALKVKRGRKKGVRKAGGAKEEEEETDEWEEEGTKRITRSTSTKEGSRKSKRIRLDSEKGLLDTLERVEAISPPAHMPSGDLLTTLLSHATSHFSSSPTPNLLPPLSSSHPTRVLPPYFEDLKKEAGEVELKAARDTSLGAPKRFKDLRRGRKKVIDPGWKEGSWRDVEGAWEGSAVVALGVLTKLLIEEKAESSSPSLTSNDDEEEITRNTKLNSKALEDLEIILEAQNESSTSAGGGRGGVRRPLVDSTSSSSSEGAGKEEERERDGSRK